MFNTHGIFLNFVQIIYFINPYEINSVIMFIKKKLWVPVIDIINLDYQKFTSNIHFILSEKAWRECHIICYQGSEPVWSTRKPRSTVQHDIPLFRRSFAWINDQWKQKRYIRSSKIVYYWLISDPEFANIDWDKHCHSSKSE